MGRMTIQSIIDSGDTVTAHCSGPGFCHHSATLDMPALREKLGPDHGAMRDDLVPKLRCTKCGSKRVGLIYTPGTKEYGGNAKWKG
jgi:hypothetical protein